MRPQEQGPPGLIETNQKTTQCPSNSMKNQNHRDSHENLCPALQLLHDRLPPELVFASRHRVLSCLIFLCWGLWSSGWVGGGKASLKPGKETT